MGQRSTTPGVVFEVVEREGSESPLMPLSLVCRWYRTRLVEIKRLIAQGVLTRLRGCGSDGIMLEQREVERALAPAISAQEALQRLEKAPPDAVEDLVPGSRTWASFPELLPKIQAYYPEMSLRELRRLTKAGKLTSVRERANHARASFRAQLGPLLLDLAGLSAERGSDADIIEAATEKLRSDGLIPPVRKAKRARRGYKPW